MVITQICIGKPLDNVESCMQTVKKFACKCGCKYRVIDSFPGWYKGERGYWDIRTMSEWVRLDILATEKYSLVIDWDIELLDGFEVPSDIAFVACNYDSMVYNHDKTWFFSNALNSLKNEDRNDRHTSQLVLYKGIIHELNNTKIKYETFNNYIHHGISRLYLNQNIIKGDNDA